jgi:hypothetical protein
MKNNFKVLLISLFCITSCTTYTDGYSKFYSKLPNAPKLKSTVPERVQFEKVNSLKQYAKRTADLKSKGYLPIGASGFEGILEDENHALKLAARVGGDHIILCREYLGKRTGTQMTLASYTPGSTITANSNFNGYSSAYGSAQTYDSYGYSNTYGSAQANYSGSSSSDIYIPAQSTYVPQSFTYEAYSQGVAIFASPKRIAEINNKR